MSLGAHSIGADNPAVALTHLNQWDTDFVSMIDMAGPSTYRYYRMSTRMQTSSNATLMATTFPHYAHNSTMTRSLPSVDSVNYFRL